MCEKITYFDLHLASMAGIDDRTCADLPYDDRNPNVFENVVLGLLL